MIFQHMLAGKVVDVNTLVFPLYASPKYDGIRAAVQEGRLTSRNQKAIPNRACKDMFNHLRFEGLDGELIVGSPTAEDCFRVTESGVMAEYGVPDVKFYVFDFFMTDNEPFHERLRRAEQLEDEYVVVVRHTLIKNIRELLAFEKKMLKEGYEGIMLRSINGPYKQGRSTTKEGWLLKKKIFCDADAKVVGLEEQLFNGNTAVRNAVGKLERSAKRDKMVGKNTMGALVVEGLNGPYKGKQFNIGTGFSDTERHKIWADKDLIGKVVKYSYFPKGAKDLPRFPVFLGFRSDV